MVAVPMVGTIITHPFTSHSILRPHLPICISGQLGDLLVSYGAEIVVVAVVYEGCVGTPQTIPKPP